MSEKPFDVDTYKDRLIELQGSGDTELQHVHADEVLCDMLNDLGFKQIVDEFVKVDKWYA